MLEVEEINATNKQKVTEFLRSNIVRHVFAFYDIQYEPEHTIMYAAFENKKLKGYILIYKALEFPSIILECDNNAANVLIKYISESRFVMHAPSNLLTKIKRKFPKAKHYVENWMLVKKGRAHFFHSESVRRLRSEKDASKLTLLLSTQKNRPRGIVRKYTDLIEKMPVYGAFTNDELVSYAGSFIQLPEVWMIGGVYTNPCHRSKGYATLTTSAVTEEALQNAETAALFVRSDNLPAIKVYEKIGYMKIDERLWVDVGTGLEP